MLLKVVVVVVVVEIVLVVVVDSGVGDVSRDWSNVCGLISFLQGSDVPTRADLAALSSD